MPKTQVYPTRLRIELEAAASTDLQDLTNEISMISDEHLPAFRKAMTTPKESQGLWISSLMAIAFEAGFHCGIQASIEVARANK